MGKVCCGCDTGGPNHLLVDVGPFRDADGAQDLGRGGKSPVQWLAENPPQLSPKLFMLHPLPLALVLGSQWVTM